MEAQCISLASSLAGGQKFVQVLHTFFFFFFLVAQSVQSVSLAKVIHDMNFECSVVACMFILFFFVTLNNGKMSKGLKG